MALHAEVKFTYRTNILIINIERGTMGRTSAVLLECDLCVSQVLVFQIEANRSRYSFMSRESICFTRLFRNILTLNAQI